MKKYLQIVLFFITLNVFSQTAYKEGEHFKFKISYGIINAGVATLDLKSTTYNGKSVYHAKGVGYTTGITKTFFKVYDDYQSYFDKKTGVPYRYIRKIDEGGYTKNQEGFFDHSSKTVLVKDYKGKINNTFNVTTNVQDIVSSFYYLRNHPKIDKLKNGESIEIDMFFDDEIYKFKLKFIGKEEIKTNFGKINTLKFRPLVQSGRVFKEQESLTVWISDDANKIPLKVQASLAVGSLKAELVKYSGLKQKLGTK
ncbi:DUF3108 domain-containing protein [Myroides ceti]|uniref:DUF3108 domain-containing protein n=1 Tax=Paenimyroides ceti TaxID=395087 RepID=A0ABT8CWF1_9FLAO|nr:DUF3108 domain-containing protein [Paenimyroides ceti]MDN3705562.1 DUF3108 domain-containing protein [Paenimyroides ceti]MDN3708853.1 DUF3108 domain-containing protein [Paenimyroides ceti]